MGYEDGQKLDVSGYRFKLGRSGGANKWSQGSGGPASNTICRKRVRYEATHKPDQLQQAIGTVPTYILYVFMY